MKLKRKFDGFLSEEHIRQQLLTLVCILVASFFLFWGISAIFFHGSFKWQEIIALYLDPGVFGNDIEKHDVFRLIITSVGIFVFTALLITVFTNVFSNISDAYKKGERRYKGLKGHTVILGSNHMLIGMLSKLRTDGSDNDILVVTSSPVEELRDKIEAYFGDKNFMGRLTFYFDERDNEHNLREACVRTAKEIFLIGEDGEIDHDSVSINCCEKLETICKDAPDKVRCFLVLDNQSSAEVYHYYSNKFSQGTQILVDVIDIKEYIAEQTLLGLNGEAQLPIDGKGIRKDDKCHINFIISGFTPMALAMARTAAHLCHFPNFNHKAGEKRTVITFIDSGMKEKMNRFVAEHSNLFDLSHYTYVSFGENDQPKECRFAPKAEYGDFLDVEWVFVDADIFSPECRKYLDAIASDEKQRISIAVCQSSQEDNTAIALHLPSAFYEKNRNIPIYAHLWEQGDVIGKANETGQFGNVYCFGTGTVADRDPLFRERLGRGQRVNSVYSKLYGGPEWYDLPESHKFSSIYSANSIPVKQRSFGDEIYEKSLSVCDTEHRRWVMAELLLGFKAYTTAERESYKAEIREEAKTAGIKEQKTESWHKLNKILRPQTFKHIDIDAFDSLVNDDERMKDIALMMNIPFILGSTDSILKI